MFKKLLLLSLAVGTCASPLTSPLLAHAATHHTITWHGKHYRSKYTIKQMRRKYHLRNYYKKDLGHVTWHYNAFIGIANGANVHNFTRGETHAHGNVIHKGRYAEFLTDQLNGGNAYSLEYVNLKTGRHYHDQN